MSRLFLYTLVTHFAYRITPYRRNNRWYFDDPKVDLVQEGLTDGTPEVFLAAGSGDIHFSTEPFVGSHRLDLIGPRRDGHKYVWRARGLRCWFCPALLRYFREPPQKIWFRASGPRHG